MIHRILYCTILVVSCSIALAEETTLSPAEQVAAIQKTCSEADAAIRQRQAKRSLYERLGRRPKINILANKIIDAHIKNKNIGHMFAKIDKKRVKRNVAEFLIAGSGGKANYKGRDMGTVHRDLKITNADFLAAGADVQAIMKEMKYGENEVQEVVCALTSFVPIVVTQK